MRIDQLGMKQKNELCSPSGPPKNDIQKSIDKCLLNQSYLPIFRPHLADKQPEAKATVPPVCQSGLLNKINYRRGNYGRFIC